MIGRLLNTIINILFLTYIILLISFFFLHETLKNNINEVNYAILDTVSTTGVFSEDTYNYLKSQVFAYGAGARYQLVIKYEKKIKPGVYDTYWKKDWIDVGNLTNTDSITGLTKNDEILTLVGRPIPMHIGDKLSIYIEAQDQTLFIKLLNAPFFGVINNYTDMRIKSLKTVVVGKNAKSIVKGYELKAEIAQKNTNGWHTFDINGNGVTTDERVTINVKTEMNIKALGTGYEYRNYSVPVTVPQYPVPQTANPTYGNNASEQYSGSTLGQNYIFDTVEFYRQVIEYYPTPDPIPAGKKLSDYEKVIEFTQK